jgi:hypothetical protein
MNAESRTITIVSSRTPVIRAGPGNIFWGLVFGYALGIWVILRRLEFEIWIILPLIIFFAGYVILRYSRLVSAIEVTSDKISFLLPLSEMTY